MSMFREFEAYVTRVIDGDTFCATIQCGFGITFNGTVRLFGIDCPETREPGGSEATKFTAALIENQWIRLHAQKKPDKYGRVLGDVKFIDTTLTEKLLEAGHVKITKNLILPDDYEDWDNHDKATNSGE